jgi:hypothetical protein
MAELLDHDRCQRLADDETEWLLEKRNFIEA